MIKQLEYRPWWKYLMDYAIFNHRDNKTTSMIYWLYEPLYLEENLKRYQKDIEVYNV